MATLTMRRTVTRFDRLQIAICVLVAATALVHLGLGAVTNVMVAPPCTTPPCRGSSGSLDGR